MVISAEPRVVDYARAWRIVLALYDGEVDRANQVISETNAEQANHLLIASLAHYAAMALQQPQFDADGVRSELERLILRTRMEGTDLG